MKQIPYKGKWAILPSDMEDFFQYHVLDPNSANHIQANPRIFGHLAEWLDSTCPNRWTTVWINAEVDGLKLFKPGILVDDQNIFPLFKLAWHDHPSIRRYMVFESTAFYCPYIPLVTTSVILNQSDDDGE